MAARTGIRWTRRTWNPWFGCTKVSPGCLNCYMYTDVEKKKRDPRTVQRTSQAAWDEPPRWNAWAAGHGVRDLVFTCSWSDWFHEDADAWRDEAWGVVRSCPHLTFQILTKRVTRVADHLPADWGGGYENVWLGTSVERDDYAFRADVLRKIPARVRTISAEPLLGPLPSLRLDGFHWLIVGGESGPEFRPMDLGWARDLRDRAVAAGVPFFYKQGSGRRSGMDPTLDGRAWREFPDGFVWTRGTIGLPVLETGAAE